MVVTNTLNAVDIGEVLEWLHSSEKTGGLALENDHFRKKIFFVGGSIAAVASNEPADSFPVHVVATGLVTQEQAEAGLYLQQRTGHAFVDVLRKTGCVDDEQLEATVEIHALEALWSAFLWNEGNFTFNEDELPEDVDAAVSLEVNELLDEGRRRRQFAEEMWAKLPSRDATFVVKADTEAVGDGLEQKMVSLLREPQTLLTLMTRLPASEHAVLCLIEKLRERDVFEIVADSDARVSDDSLPVEATPVEQEADTVANTDTNSNTAPAYATMRIELAPEAAQSFTSRPSLKLLALARGAMEQKRYDEALHLFRKAESGSPDDTRLRGLRESAEAVYCEILQQSELPLGSRVMRLPSHSVGQIELRDAEQWILTSADGTADVRSMVDRTDVSRVEILSALLNLKRRGLVAVT